MPKKYERIFTLNEPNAPRINPALACEIGLNESIVLLQIEFWISISDNWHDGQKWTYQSVRDMRKKSFPFWSISTINRAVTSLIKSGYLIEGNYNKYKYDKTRWFALNFKKLSELKSISIKGYGTGASQNDTGSNQNDTGSNQNDTPIPETTAEITKQRISIDNSEGVVNNCHEYYELYIKERSKWFVDSMGIHPKAKKSILDGQIKEIVNHVPREEWRGGITQYFVELQGKNDGHILAFLKAAPRFYAGLSDVWLECGWWGKKKP